MIPVSLVVGLGLVLFAIGLAGVLIRKNLVIMLMSLELLLNGVNVILAGLGRRWMTPRGSAFALFVIAVAVSEAAVGFALILSAVRLGKSPDADSLNELKG